MGKSRTSGLSKNGGQGLFAGGVAFEIGNVKTMSISDLSKLSDKEMAEAVYKINDVELPDGLRYEKEPNDPKPIDDLAQKFFYANGLNAKPTVLDDAEFSEYMKDNGLGKSQILTRDIWNTSSISADSISNDIRYGKNTYLGGQVGGNAEGMGIYFARTGGESNWIDGVDLYNSSNSKTMLAVLDTKKFNPIEVSYEGLFSKWNEFVKTHPETAKAMNDVVGSSFATIGSDVTIKASLMGYNVLKNNSGGLSKYMDKKTDNSDFYNVIDRSVLVIRKANKRK